METTDTREILWANIEELMAAAYGEERLSKFAEEAGVGNATMTRIKAKASYANAETLEKIAGKFSLQAWQLLAPKMGRYSGETPVDAAAAGLENGPSSAVDEKDAAVRSQQEILWNLWVQMREEDREEWLASARRAITARRDSDLDASIAALTSKPRVAKKA